MADIKLGEHGKVKKAKRRMPFFLKQLEDDWSAMTLVDRWALIRRVAIALVRIQLDNQRKTNDIE